MGKRANGEGSVYRRKSDGKWVGSFTLENGKRKVFYGKTQKEVLDKLKVALHEQQQETLIVAPKQTVEQFLTDWLENTQRRSVRPRTYERYEELMRLHVIPALGKYQLQKLSAQRLQAFYTKKQDEGFSTTTVAHIHNVLHKALEAAVKWNLIPKNVCDLVSPPRKSRFEIQPLTMEQVHKLLDVAKGHYMEALFNLALATGMRRGELMGLKWQDIDFTTGTLQVRSIVIAPFALEALSRHRTRQLEAKLKAGPFWQDHDYVFCTSIGTPLNPTRDILDQLKLLLKKAGLPNIRFHDLRHSTATLLLSMGVHPKVVQEILGHSQISMTLDVYSHVLPSIQQDAIIKLNNAIQLELGCVEEEC